MTVLKDPVNARPASQHRHAGNLMPGSLPKTRPHPHSAAHPAHRVTRRKSMSSSAATNVAAMVAAARGTIGAPLEGGSSSGSTATAPAQRRSSKPPMQFRGPALHAVLASSMPTANNSPLAASSYSGTDAQGEAVVDGPVLASMAEHKLAEAKSRVRRASEGVRLKGPDGKRVSGSELKCEKCGKGYKHSSCLTKHLWEHTPEWQYTSKLLISKHQQVQLLEAASVLVAMNKESEDGGSDRSSPPASGSSDPRGEPSSTETTPPPHMDDPPVGSFSHSHFDHRSTKRFSTNSSAYSHSYQSTVFSDNGAGGHVRHWSNVSDRPTTSGTSVAGSYLDDTNDHADLAAAVGLLSCSFGTPQSGLQVLSPGIPPVPPLPAKFLDFQPTQSLLVGTTVQAQQSDLRNSYRFQTDNKDVEMDDDHFADEEDYRQSNSRSRGRVDEDDDAFFGRMEE